MGIDGWWPDEGDVLPTPSRLARNRIYWEGPQDTPDRRPFALHRNCYAGIQRWGWLWSGDTDSTWKTLETQIMEGINAGLNGVPTGAQTLAVSCRRLSSQPNFSCAGSNSARSVRRSDAWAHMATSAPVGMEHGKLRAVRDGSKCASFLRTWKTCTTKLSAICRKFLETRYRLLPYLYSAAYEAHTTGLRLSAAWDWSFRRTRRHGNSRCLFVGSNLLVAPIFEKCATKRTLNLPAGTWWDFWTNQRIEGGRNVTLEAALDSMPLLVRGVQSCPPDR